jgi:hypothetical protein
MKKLNNLLPRVGLGVALAIFLLIPNMQAQVRFGDNLGNHTATQPLKMQGFDINKSGSMQYNTLDLSGTAIANTYFIGAAGGSATTTATATVDLYTSFIVKVATANDNIFLSPPTTTLAGRIAFVINAGSVVLTLGTNKTPITPGTSLSLIWNGTSWIENGSSKAVAISSLIAAGADNTIDNTNFAQKWDWSTATTQTGLDLTANALTTGSVLSITSSSTTNTGTNGLLNVANTTATTTGTVARIQANSTAAGSGLTVLASGNVGIGTAAPQATLHNAGSTIIGGSTDVTFTDATAPAAFSTASAIDGVTILRIKATTTTVGVVPATTLPALTAADAGRIITVINEGTTAGSNTPFNIHGAIIALGNTGTLIWDGTQWIINGSQTASPNKYIAALDATATTKLDNSTTYNGSTNSSYTVTFTGIPGLLATDFVTVNYYGTDYTSAKWLATGTADANGFMAGENDGVVIIGAVATADGSVSVTLANGVAGSIPNVTGLRLLIGFTH